MNDELRKKRCLVPLTRGDIGNMITALDLAVKYQESCIRAERPATPRREWTPAVRQEIEEWFADTRIFRSLRRKLAALEAR